MQTTRKHVRAFLLMLLLLAMFSCLGGISAKAEVIKLKNGKRVNLTIPEYSTVILQISPKPEKKVRVRWKTDAKSVAGIKKYASRRDRVKIIAGKPGKAVITVTAGDLTYTCRVRVTALKLSEKSISLPVRRSRALSVAGLNKKQLAKVRWASSDPAIATVSQDGLVKAVSPGTCRVTAVYADRTLSAQVTVTPITVDGISAAYSAAKTEPETVILLAGSSSIDYWDDAHLHFSPWPVINTGIGGTTVTQWMEWYQALIVPYQPAAIVLYVGSNDLLFYGVSGEENARNTAELLRRIRAKLPKTPIYYVSVVPCYVGQHAWEQIAKSNRLVSEYCATAKGITYIDLASRFAKDGLPDRSLFADQLHANSQGYLLWKKYVAQPVLKDLGAAGKDDKELVNESA